ncbi:MAG: hypothetical protein WKG00_30505 [Polyangiaceae bacterium]
MRSRPAVIALIFVLGTLLGCAIGLFQAPDQPYWAHLLVGVVVGVLLAFLLDRLRTLQMEAFDAARHGDPARVRGMLGRRLGGRWTSTEISETPRSRPASACPARRTPGCSPTTRVSARRRR